MLSTALVALAPLACHRRAATAATAASCSVDASHLPLDAEEQALLDQTNAYRLAAGLPALQPSATLTQIALWKSGDMASREYVAHDDAFRSWAQRFADCGYDTSVGAIGENLAAGNATGVATLLQWEQSPEHNANLLAPDFSAIGIKRVQSAHPASDYGWYWAMELGSSLDANQNAALAGH